jgi:MFS family permease
VRRYVDFNPRALLFLFVLWFLWFNNFSVRTIFSPILPLIEDEFGVNHSQASGIMVFQSVGYAISLVFSGFFSGRFGYKRSILFSLVISACVYFAIPSVQSFAPLNLFSFILGLAAGVYIPSVLPLITECYSERMWGKAISVHDSAAAVGVFSAPFIALAILQFTAWRGIFYVMGASFLAAGVAFYFLSEELVIRQTRRASFGHLGSDRRIWVMGVLWIFAAGANLGIYFIMPLYLTKELHLDIGFANTIFGISRLGGVAVSISAGFLVDRFSLNKTMFCVLLIAGIFTTLIPFVGERLLAYCLFLQASVITGFFAVALVALSRLFDRESRSMATGLILSVAVVFGMGIIPYLLGLSGDLISFKLGITILGILVMLSSGLIFTFKKT